MADPIIRVKRSSVAGKIPTSAQLPLGEVALNTYDGKFYASRNVGVGTTVFTVNPWTAGLGTSTYNTFFTEGNVGIGNTNPQNPLHISGTQGTLLRIDGGSGGTGTRDIVITEFDTPAYGGIIRYDSSQDTFTIGTLENSVVQYALNIARATGNVGVGYTQLNPTVKLAVNGTTLINTNSLTGTASQPLQVNGGAYVSGSVGIGTTNPTSKLHIIGNTLVVGVVTATTFSGNLALSNVTGLGANVATFLTTPSSANLAAALTDETGSGANVFATSPTLVTPVIGAATATSVTGTGSQRVVTVDDATAFAIALG